MEFMKSSPLKSSFSRSEARLEESGRAARDIVARDTAIRLKNTALLKAARLARDAEAPPPVVAAPAPRAKRQKKTATS